MILYPILIGAGTIVGLVVGYFVRKKLAQAEADSLEAKVQTMLSEAKAQEKEILIDAKDKAIKIVDEAKRDETTRRNELRDLQHRLENRETLFDQKLLDLESKQTKLHEKAAKLEEIKLQIQQIKKEQMDKLERIAALTREDAKKVLLENVEKETGDALASRIRKLEADNSIQFENVARAFEEAINN